jgi:putative heme-binding domain-containing protein
VNHVFQLYAIWLASVWLALPAKSDGVDLLSPVTNAPPVQMLVPGFTARELPLVLNNINNLVYAPDGRLFALGYDGNIHQLKDTDGDGLEDSATFFYKNERNEILPSIGMAWGPGGLYIASQKRVLRIRDKGDGSGELETVTTGWVEPTGVAGSNLDSVGIAVDLQGNIFFGLGSDKWNEPYRINKESGKSEYNLQSERGTILQISPDWKTRKIVATGLRFAVSLAFNANGDLFCTDQEGATWLANGNPFDELLHIQPGRHYGFPPQHPKYLPQVVDEPGLFDYTPQHQSTCGLHFNEPASKGGPGFGPDWWRGDAVVAGESRGKIWRTRLVKTRAGYVAHTDLIACLQMLTLDAVPTPQGDLLVACHSGKPDWGTGPQGKGKLFKISFTDRSTPQPVFAFALSPTETRITFDRPIDPTQLKHLARSSGVITGRYVGAGDRFELLRPGYQVVKDQMDAPRRALQVLSAGVTADHCAIVLQTVPRTEVANYAVTVPRPKPNETTLPLANESFDATDLLMDLSGVQAVWMASRGKETKETWLPHLDLEVAQALTGPSQQHRRFFELFQKPGTLTLRAQLDLSLMLHPHIQPGAKIDYEYPRETVTLVLRSAAKLELKSSGRVKRINDRELHVTQESVADQWLPIELRLATGKKAPALELTWFTAADPRPRPMPRRRILLPWATAKAPEALVSGPRRLPEVAGGDWDRGKKVYFSEQAACFKCHQVRNEGGKIGPDLNSLTQRDYASVLKDITEPSAAINPEHLSYNVELKSAEAITGVVLDSGPEKVVLGQVTGASVTILKDQISSMKASSVSLMPEGLLQSLSSVQQKDLLTFLLTEPPPQTGSRK